MSAEEKSPKGVAISVLGREFRVACPEGEEKQLMASVDYLNRKLKEVRDGFFRQGVLASGSSPEEFAAFIASESVKWSRAVKSSGAKVD